MGVKACYYYSCMPLLSLLLRLVSIAGNGAAEGGVVVATDAEHYNTCMYNTTTAIAVA